MQNFYSILQTRPSAATSGSTFREGRHMVVYVAKDNSGLTSTCSFEFEVEGRLNINKVDEVDNYI